MKKIAFLLLCLTLVLSACGGGSKLSSTIDVTMTDFHFEPGESTIPAGQEITLNATNSGAVKHEFVIMKYGFNVGEDFGPEDEGNIYWEVEVEPGESKSVTFTAPSDLGEYQIICGIGGHFKAGMFGKLTVAAAK